MIATITAALYWGGVIVNATLIRKRSGTRPSLRPQRKLDYLLWLSWTAIILLWAGTTFWTTTPEASPKLDEVREFTGILFIVIGFLGTWWCYATMGDAWAISVKESQTNQLIQHGPYRTVRHPIYTLQWLILFGNCLIYPESTMIVALAILSISMTIKARLEEESLGKIFGEEYKIYFRKTGRFVPALIRNLKVKASS